MNTRFEFYVHIMSRDCKNSQCTLSVHVTCSLFNLIDIIIHIVQWNLLCTIIYYVQLSIKLRTCTMHYANLHL